MEAGFYCNVGRVVGNLHGDLGVKSREEGQLLNAVHFYSRAVEVSAFMATLVEWLALLRS